MLPAAVATAAFIADHRAGRAIATVLLVITLVIVVPYMVWTARQEKNS